MILDGHDVRVENFLDRWGLDARITGNEYLCRCPWRTHSSGQHKLYINAESGLWQCKACPDKRGNFVALVADLEGLERDDARLYIKDNSAEIDIDTWSDRIIDLLHEDDSPISIRTDAALRRETLRVLRRSDNVYTPYWKLRGISEDAVRYWNLRYKRYSTYSHIIPITVDGSPRYYIGRTSSSRVKPKYLYQKHFSRASVLLGLDHAESSTLVLTEGPLDAIYVWQALNERRILHKYSPVSILGAFVSIRQKQLIEQYADHVILFFDNDRPGEEAIKTARGLKGVTVSRVHYTSGGKDPGDLTTPEIIDMLKNADLILDWENP